MKKKVLGIILLAVLLLAGCGKSLEAQVAEQLELGQRYLEELDYEQAIVAFNKVIELEPLNQTAYENLVVIYEKTGQLEELMNLASRYEEAGGTELPEILEEIKACREEIHALMELCETEDYEQIFARMQRESYQNLIDFAAALEGPLIWITGEKGFGIYPVESDIYGNFMIYYGDYQNTMRYGHGIWIAYYEGYNYHAKGEWMDDKPNGDQSVREWHGGLDEIVVYRVIEGTVENGLWNGAVRWIFEDKGETIRAYSVSFTKGKWDILEKREDEDEVIYRVSEEIVVENGESVFLSADDPDEILGIEGFFAPEKAK